MVDDSRLDGLFHALSSGTRRAILFELSRSDRTVGELAEPYEMTLAAVAKHIDVLERAGLVTRKRHGRTTVCHLNADQLQDAARALDYYRGFWNQQLDSLDAYF